MNAYRRSSKLFSNDDVVRSSDSVFWFIEGHEDSLNNSTSDGARGDIIDVFDEEVEGENSAIELQSKKNFWENQHNLLQVGNFNFLIRFCDITNEISAFEGKRE